MNDEIHDVIDVSLDIETLATTSNAVVISIGACTQDSNFHCYLDFQSQHKLERLIEGSTILWHLEKHNTLFNEQCHGMINDSVPADDALARLIRWFRVQVCGGIAPAFQVWMNSPSFDSMILQDLAKQVNQSLPWTYKQERDLRTLKAMAEACNSHEYSLLPSPSDDAHDALVDAQYQLKIISRCKTILNC